MRFRHGTRLACGAALALFAQPAMAQVYVNTPGNIPSGSPNNNSLTEQVDFADIDLDGDWDCGFADGGDCCNDQNRLWVNLGGAQAGTLGFFADETATRAPLINDTSRDIEFIDFDGDGDPDVYVANTAQITNQAGRWWGNQGGLQAGATGFYADETAARWVGLGGPGSSVPPAFVLGSGGFITFTQDQDFADIDNDGDLDLIAATVGGSFSGIEPTRVFLNDGLGNFSEFNPSGFQLTSSGLPDGSPALWCEGLQQNGTTNVTGAFADITVVAQETVVGDIDGDLDLDVLLVERGSTPRMYRNRLSDIGALAFRDVTGATWPQGWGNSNGKYDSELGDLDGDGDLDLYGVNWFAPYNDLTLRGAGDGTFVDPTAIAGTAADDDGSELVDYDSDGDLDVYIAAFSGNDKLAANGFAGAGLVFNLVNNAISGLPNTYALDANAADVDADGDYDVMRAGPSANVLLLNVLTAVDTTAPRLAKLEQPADQATGQATPIRVQAYDNASPYLLASNQNELLYQLNNGPQQSVAMTWSGGQILRAELPASAVGNVRYQVRSTDEHGNVGLSALKAIDTGGGCSGQPATYCTAKLASPGCLAQMEFEGAPKLGGLTSFVVRATDVVAVMNGLLFYSKNGPAALPFAGGVLCVGTGLVRTPGQNSGGVGACGGVFQFDFNAWIALGSDPGLVAGQSVWAQYWFRDPPSTGGSGLSNALTFTICP